MEEITKEEDSDVLNRALTYTNTQNDDESVEIMVIEYVEDNEGIQNNESPSHEYIHNQNSATQNCDTFIQEPSNGDSLNPEIKEAEVYNNVNVISENDQATVTSESASVNEDDCDYMEEEYLTENCEEESKSTSFRLALSPTNSIEAEGDRNNQCESLSERNFLHKCNECGVQFISETILKYHRYKNNHDLPFTCRECKQQFMGLSEIIKHEEEHSLQRPYQCLDCCETFELANELLTHRKVHIISSSSLNKNNKVSQKCKNIIHGQRHLESKKFQCSKCGLASPNMRYHRKHLLRHKRVSSFICHICNDMFPSAPELKKHIKTHNGFEFQCMDCFKTFKEADDLKSHREVHSSNAYIPILPKPMSNKDFKMIWKS